MRFIWSRWLDVDTAAHRLPPHHARPVFEAIGLLQEEEVIAKARLSVSDLGIRGPPAV